MVILTGFTAQARVEKKAETKPMTAQSQEDALTAVVEPNINWGEWENEFDASLTDTSKTKQPPMELCLGRNCSFKDKTALEPSTEF